MKELANKLQFLKLKLQKELEDNKELGKIVNISYYGKINLEGNDAVSIYLVEKEIDGKIQREIQTENRNIATIDNENVIHTTDDCNSKELLNQLKDVSPISLKALEERYNNKEENIQPDKKAIENSKDIEIDMDKKITQTKTFEQLVPEIKEKEIESVKVRRLGMTSFEFYGIGKNGQEIVIESLKLVEGTNPNKEIYEVNKDGSKVNKDSVFAMFKIENGTNEQAGNEGFTIDLEDETGITEVGYYRRSKDNEYTSIPVNLKSTNQKRTEKEVREYGTKQKNTGVSDNIERADDNLSSESNTYLNDIDDNPYNDNPENTNEYEEELIKEAALRCKVTINGFKKELGKDGKEGEDIEDRIKSVEEEINEQVMGNNRRTR